MHIFLYEWITGGGLVEEPGALPRSLLTEGSAMLSALAADFLLLDGARVSLLRDMRLDDLVLPECEVMEVHSKYDQQEEFSRLASEADYTLVIAPEIDGVLLSMLALARQAGGQLLTANEDFVRLASDKHQTAERLAEANVPVPEAMLLDADQEKLPRDFGYPAVLKPTHGAGSQHTFLVTSPQDDPPPHPWPRRLERFFPGTPVSVSFLCGPEGRHPLPAFRQHLSRDGRFSYLGGSRLEQEELVRRATELAERAMAALPPASGYVGVDLVLGKAGDGSEDVVLEVNPRLTTSYVGLRSIACDNLAHAMIENVAGRPHCPDFHSRSVEFLIDGTVCQPGENSAR